jgi:hypothetical protein
MAQLEDMRLPADAREALVDDPCFLRQVVEAALNGFLDAEITEHLQAGPPPDPRCANASGGPTSAAPSDRRLVRTRIWLR